MVNHIAKFKDGVIMNKNIWGFGFYMKTAKVLKVLRFIFMEEISQKKQVQKVEHRCVRNFKDLFQFNKNFRKFLIY